MGGNTKALRARIKSVTSTLQLTKAMGLVASSKIRKANEAMQNARQYGKALDEAMSVLASDKECEKSPYLAVRDGGRTRIIVIAGDRGLAGGYNANVFRLCAQHKDAEFIPIGKRACERYGKTICSSERYTFGETATLADKLCKDFLNGEYDRLGIIYTRYVSVMSQEATYKQLLPLSFPKKETRGGMIFEPDCLTALNASVREYVAGSITAAVRESFACEVTARRMAMDSAGKNAKEMIDGLSLEYNRARQGAITQEITEIVAGSGN